MSNEYNFKDLKADPTIIDNESGGGIPTKKVDMVNHPPHYQLEVKGVKIEVLDAIAEILTKEEFIGYLKGNCLKYQLRAKKKGQKEDWQKAAFYFKILDGLLKK